MGMLNDILVNAKSAVQKAGEKASDVCDVSKLKITRKRIKNDVYKNYTILGRKVYAASKNGELDDADFSEEFDIINDLHEQYDEITKKIDELKHLSRCSVCQQILDDDCDVCPECGNEL